MHRNMNDDILNSTTIFQTLKLIPGSIPDPEIQRLEKCFRIDSLTCTLLGGKIMHFLKTGNKQHYTFSSWISLQDVQATRHRTNSPQIEPNCHTARGNSIIIFFVKIHGKLFNFLAIFREAIFHRVKAKVSQAYLHFLLNGKNGKAGTNPQDKSPITLRVVKFG